MSSSWNKIELPEPMSFQDIMQEELSKNLQDRIDLREYHVVSREDLLPNEKECRNHYYEEPLPNDSTSGSRSEILGDALKEKMDLREYHIVDREDLLPDKKVECCDRSYEEPLSTDYSSESDDLEDARDKAYWDKYDTVMRKFDPIPVNVRGNVTDITKQLAIIDVIDNKTRLILQEMIDSRLFHNAKIIARGKNAIILHAIKKLLYEPDRNYIIKVLKRKHFSISRRNAKDSYRCKMKIVTKTISSKLLFSKTLKERMYLKRLFRAGVLCPTVISSKENVQVMSFIGKGNPAPTLRDARLSMTEATVAFKQIREYMKKFYIDCKFIHTKLDEHHLLWFDGNCYVIDLNSAVEIWEENALDFLYNDCKKICEFFASLKVPNIVTPAELFLDITSCNYLDKIALTELKKSIKSKGSRCLCSS